MDLQVFVGGSGRQLAAVDQKRDVTLTKGGVMRGERLHPLQEAPAITLCAGGVFELTRDVILLDTLKRTREINAVEDDAKHQVVGVLEILDEGLVPLSYEREFVLETRLFESRHSPVALEYEREFVISEKALKLAHPRIKIGGGAERCELR